jgi:hypothetical protein
LAAPPFFSVPPRAVEWKLSEVEETSACREDRPADVLIQRDARGEVRALVERWD